MEDTWNYKRYLDNATAAYETAEASVAMSSADLDQAELELGYTLSLIHI